MKNFNLILFTLFMATFAMAQETEPADSTKSEEETYSIGNPPDRDTTKIEEGGEVVVDFKFGDTDTTKNIITRMITFGLGFNTVLDGQNITNPSLQNDWDLRTLKSTHLTIGIINWKINLTGHKLYLQTGINGDYYKYMFEDNFWIDPESDNWETDYAILDGIETKKNRLITNYINIPLMLNFESSTQHFKSFRLSAGGFGGIRGYTNHKIKFEDKDDNPFEDKIKYKEKDNYNLNNFTYGLQGVIGYGPVNLYGKYHLQEIFEEDSNSPRLNNLSIGIMLLPF